MKIIEVIYATFAVAKRKPEKNPGLNLRGLIVIKNTTKYLTTQNHMTRMIFFATLYRKETNWISYQYIMFTACMSKSSCTYLWHRGMHVTVPSTFVNMFRYARCAHGYNPRYASNENLWKSGVKTKKRSRHKNPTYGSCSLERFSFDTRIFRRLFHPLSV